MTLPHKPHTDNHVWLCTPSFCTQSDSFMPGNTGQNGHDAIAQKCLIYAANTLENV